MANSNTYVAGLAPTGAEVSTLSQVQSNGLLLPVPTGQFIDTRAPGKLEVIFNTGNNSEVIYSKNKPQDLYLKGLVQSQLAPPFYVNPNQGQRQKINANRIFPVEAALRDTTRVSRFLGSSKGVTFFTKQLLLQGLQTFDETKVYNPASPILAAFWPASFGLLNRPQRFIDTSNLLGGLIGAAGLGGVVNTIGGLFGKTAANPPPPRSTVASADSEPKSGLGGFFNIGGIFGGGDKSDVVLPIMAQDGAKGLIRGNTATNAYNASRYSSLIPPSGGGGFFGNLLKAAGSFLKNNSLLGGIFPPTQPIAGLKYRADENTYQYMLTSDRWSAFATQATDTNPNLSTGVNQGNYLLYSGTQSKSQGGFFGALLKGIGLNTNTVTNAGSVAIRFYNGGNSTNKLRLYVNGNTANNRTNSKLGITFDTTGNLGKLDLSDTSKVTQESIDSVNGSNISNGSNRYGDVVKVTPDNEFSDQLLNYNIFTDKKLSTNYKTTFTDKTSQLVSELNNIFESTQTDVRKANYSYTAALGKPQQFLGEDIGFNYIAKVKSARSKTTPANDPDSITYQGKYRKNQDTIKFPSRFGQKQDKDRFIRPTNDVDYVNSLGVMNDSEFTDKYDSKDKWNGLGPDFIKFYFYDIVNNRFIPFNATIKGIQENNTANWEPVEYLGRPDKLYYYKNFSRDLNLGFKVVAHSVKELMPMWQRINYLVGLTRPANYTSTVNGGFMIPPMVQLTLGDFYKKHFVVITSVNVQIPDDASWELLNEDYIKNNDWNFNIGRIYKDMKGKVAQFPREADITMQMFIMEKDRAKTGRAVWGNAPVSTFEINDENGEPGMSQDNYGDKSANVSDNSFSLNMRYDTDVQGQ
jgi:hypothetical protein